MQPEFLPLGDTIVHHNGQSILCFKGSEFVGVFSPEDPAVKELSGKRYTNKVLSNPDIKKFFVPYYYSFGHFFTDTLSAIVSILDKNLAQGIKTTLIVPPMGPKDLTNQVGAVELVRYVSDHLSNLGVELQKIPDTSSDEAITLVEVSGLELQPLVSFNAQSMKRVRQFVRSLPEISGRSAHRKLYLSREKTNDSSRVLPAELLAVRNGEEYFPPNYLRISNEPKLVEFIESLNKGVEKIMPEEFTSFKDQIRTFSEADLIISVTSSSLFNMLFMRENSTVIELVTPLTVWDDDRKMFVASYHNHYSLLSFICGINYIGIPHNRDVDQIIDKLDRYMF
jgi:capsular polysaccharide biosynthesis protein